MQDPRKGQGPAWLSEEEQGCVGRADRALCRSQCGLDCTPGVRGRAGGVKGAGGDLTYIIKSLCFCVEVDFGMRE